MARAEPHRQVYDLQTFPARLAKRQQEPVVRRIVLARTRAWRGGEPDAGRRSTPPPIVPTGDPPRMTNRSPARATMGASRTTRAGFVSPAANGPPGVTIRAPTSVVPRWKRTAARGDSTATVSASRPRPRERHVSGANHSRPPARRPGPGRRLDAGECDGEARSWSGAIDRGAVCLHASHANGALVRHHPNDIVARNGAAPDGSRHDRTCAANGEHAVDRHPKDVVVAPRLAPQSRRSERVTQLRQSAPVTTEVAIIGALGQGSVGE